MFCMYIVSINEIPPTTEVRTRAKAFAVRTDPRLMKDKGISGLFERDSINRKPTMRTIDAASEAKVDYEKNPRRGGFVRALTKKIVQTVNFHAPGTTNCHFRTRPHFRR